MLNVLIVDDKPAVIEGLREMIPWSDIDARIAGEASNGQEALAIALDERPDIVITDIRMPELDGLQLCEILSHKLPNTAFIILSAYQDFGYAQSAIRFGVKDYILKPIDYDKLDGISQRIKQLARQTSVRHSMQAMMHDSSMQEKLQTALRNGDTNELALFFDRELSVEDMPPECSDLFGSLFLKLHQILLEFTGKTGLNPHSLTEFRQIDDLTAMKAFIRDRYMQTAELVKLRTASRTEALINGIRSYILENYQNPDLTVYTLADKLNITPNYAGLIFHRYTGEHISSFIARLRMDKAAELLLDPRIPVQRIALEAGYMDAHYFARVFKRETGFTPSQYRNLHVKAEERAP
ncbi:response regulator [Cohnella fermenti]|uniref:Response regulator n=1 Tax=Cohnella fermenti TaxID=2565925 RepID=A0A4S4BPB9_9BACL|nr:response regulator [Cohnella fermenti]THF76703.1 response regulator [Cohnella fermenti]